MDKELLNALDNLSISLEAIAEILGKNDSKQKSATSEALVGGDFSKQLIEISAGIEEIKKDNKKILKNQETILQISKEKSKSGGLLGNTSNKEAIKQGVGSILLI